VFLILVLTGTYPASVAEQKYFDIYAVDIAKYW